MKNKIQTLLLLAITAIAFVSCDDDETLPSTKACFSFEPAESIQVGDTVFFKNCSEEATEYAWNFGDEGVSTDAEPFHIYEAPGSYSVNLVATNGTVNHTATRTVDVAADLAYVINYDSYSGDKATISAYNPYTDEVTNGYYKSVNLVGMIANVQYAYNYKGNIYFMDNNADGISWVDANSFEQTANAITEGIVKPRFCVGHNDFLYVSCYGGDVWGDVTLGYIAKINLKTKEVSKIEMPGGPEGAEIIDGKLYVALRYGKKMGIMDLATEEISYVDCASQPVFLEKDPQNNLYVVLTKNYGDTETQTGITLFNTQSNTFGETYALDGIGNTYDNVIEANSDFTKLYVTNSKGWGQPGGVAIFDVAAKQFAAENHIDGVEAMNGMQVVGDKIYCFVSPNTTSNGKAIIFSMEGEKVTEFETGISPIMIVKSK